MKQRKQNGLDRLSLYHLVRGAGSMREKRGAPMFDMRGRTMNSREAARLSPGVFVGVQERR